MPANHTWRFFRAGGFDQVKLETGEDLLCLDQLDQKLWVALACPTTGLEFDKTTLALMDSDKDGRVRASELLAAVKWATGLLKYPDDLLKGSATLCPAAINEATPEGKLLVAFAKKVLGKADNSEITVEEAQNAAQAFAAHPLNGDGVVPADSASDEATKTVINEIITCFGSVPDASGKPGINQAKVEQFFTETTAYSDWWKKAESDSAVLPLGLATAEAAAAVKTVKTKVEDYLTRCRLASFDPRTLGALNRDEKEFLAFSAKDLSLTSPEIAALPLARVDAGRPLPLQEGLNPAWAASVALLQAKAIEPLLGQRSVLTEADWATLLSRLVAYETWSASKAGSAVEKLGLARVREILAGKAKENLTALIAADKAEEGNAQAVVGLNRLLHYQRDLYQFCLNFVSFRDFYGRKKKAIFQAGTLYLDQRSCDLCLVVEEAGKHAAMAALAGTYLAYCDCARKATNEKMTIVAAFTDGDSDNLMVGRNGIFYDRKGRDWDATITKIIDNPISIRQAFWAPYKKLVRLVEEQLAKRAATADAAITADMQKAAEATVGLNIPKIEPKKFDTGTLAAIGLVLGSVLTALSGIFAAIFGLPMWQIPLALGGLILSISLPSMFIAWLKLLKRNLGPILDANGWAINAKAKMNVPFGGSLTAVPTLPPGSQRDLVDPFAEKERPWKLYFATAAILLLAFCWYIGKLDGILPKKLKSVIVLGENAPAIEWRQNLSSTNAVRGTSGPASTNAVAEKAK